MKPRIILVLLLLFSTIFTLSCITSHDIHVEISCEEFTENPRSMQNDFQIEVGDKIYVELCSNTSTGFEWNYEMSGDNALKEEDHDFEEPDGNVVGAPGKEVWTFEGVSSGDSEILLEYSQPWDGGIKQEWIYRMTVTVQ